jgi:3-hydroxymyristoyl/3-hydroxydecanoyl-(acyl carrier protein) dehydratase
MMKPFMQQLSQLSGSANHLTASASVPADSVWYAGHFPGTPLLPGIAILALVEEAISEAEFREGRAVMMTGVSRVRFRLPVRPDDRMVIQISREKRNGGFTYGFSVFLSEELACAGFFTARVVAR